MKRILAILLSVVMLLSMVIVPASASATLTPTVTVETVADEVEAGDTVTLKVEIANNPGFTNFEWSIDYDTEKLDLKSFNPTFKYEMPGLGEMDVPYIDNATVEGNIQTGKIGCIRANAFTKDGVLFTLTFDVKDAAAAVGGKVAVEIKSDLFGGYNEGNVYSDIDATYVPGGVTVAHICGNVTFVEGQTATCTVPGWNGYYKCTCGMLYVDRACQDVIEDLETWKTGDGKTTADHIYGDWTSNDEKHWKACACGEKTLEGDHQYDDDADTICNDCNYTRTTGGSTTGGSTTGGSTTGGSTTGGSTTGGSTTGGSTTGGSTTGGSTTGGSTTGGSTTGGSTTGATTLVIDVNDITIASAGTYTGYALTPAVSVNGLTSSDFTVEYYNNINAGDGAYVVIKPVEGGNYTFAPVTKNFTINKAIITITAKNYQIKVGESAPVLDGTSYSVSGLLGADTLITKPTLAYNSTPDTSKTGTYSIVVSGATASENYKISYVNGSLVIVEADQPIINWYTLKFETNGGTAVPSVRVKENTVVTLSDYETSKNGYQFAGWYIDKALTQTFTFVTINSDMTVYAKWVALECKGDSDCIGNTFTDFDHTEWYHQGIDFVINNNLMVGMDNNKFEPHTISSRAMALTVLYRLEGKPAVSIENPFVDVENGQWYTDAIVWAASKGIVNGYGDGRFGTNDDMTREQMAKIMYNYAKYKGYDISTRASLASFTDADKINPWAVEEMKWAVSVGLIKGISTTELAPQGNAERCQLATVLMRFCNLFVK